MTFVSPAWRLHGPLKPRAVVRPSQRLHERLPIAGLHKLPKGGGIGLQLVHHPFGVFHPWLCPPMLSVSDQYMNGAKKKNVPAKIADTFLHHFSFFP